MGMLSGKKGTDAYIALCNRRIEEFRKIGSAWGVTHWTEQRRLAIEFNTWTKKRRVKGCRRG